MKALFATLAAVAILMVVGCADNPSGPVDVADRALSSQFQKHGGDDLLSEPGELWERRRDSSKVEGRITAVDTIAGTVTIDTRVVQTDSSTKIERNDVRVHLSAIQLGDKGEAQFRRGSIVASKLEAKGPGGGSGGEDTEVRGMVTAVDSGAGTLTIGTTLVRTNAQTIIERNHTLVTLSAIQVGDRAEARIPAGSIYASRIEAESEVELEVRGTVTAVDTGAATLTIGTTLVQTNAQTRIERNHALVGLSAIQVGDRGKAKIPVGSAFASRVEAESEDH